jgi:ABC-type glycerol-3-phosphate transport system substrate-binding protein
MAIPYYNGTVLFAYNKALLSKYDVAPPTTWAEFTAACTKMKKAGLDYPFAAFWDADFGIVFYNFLAHCASEGMTTGFNASTLEPTFDTNPIAISVLEQWREWFSKGFVAPDILASTYTSVSNLFSAGKAAFSLADNQFVKPWQVTKGTPAYGNTKIALMPGTTHGTMTFMAVYAMTKSTPHREATWEFMKFMAWRDSKQQSQYVVPYGYLVEDFGLTAPYKGLLAEPNVRAAFSFFDYDVFVKQSSLAQAMLFPVDRASWYTGFQTYIGTQLQAAVVGQTTPAKALKAAANYARKQIK